MYNNYRETAECIHLTQVEEKRQAMQLLYLDQSVRYTYIGAQNVSISCITQYIAAVHHFNSIGVNNTSELESDVHTLYRFNLLMASK